jgi:hypothetical protein
VEVGGEAVSELLILDPIIWHYPIREPVKSESKKIPPLQPHSYPRGSTHTAEKGKKRKTQNAQTHIDKKYKHR